MGTAREENGAVLAPACTSYPMRIGFLKYILLVLPLRSFACCEYRALFEIEKFDITEW